MGEADARMAGFAHRAIVDAVVAGLVKARTGMRVVSIDAGAGAEAEAGESAGADLDVVLMTVRGWADEGAAVMGRARAMVGETGVVALIVGSRVTRELVEGVRAEDADATAAKGADAYGRAMDWARARRGAVAAPEVEPEGLAWIVDAAAAVGLVLVEPETATLSPALARIRGMRTPRARALLASVALGASARPMLFVPAARAPKGGLARWKVERITDGWVAAAGAGDAGDGPAPADDRDLLQTALAILHDAARDGRPPLLFKELLREARDRWAAAARARGARASASSTDAVELATFLVRRAADESVLLYALDPADPGWTLTALAR